jgi:hypothetical protein
MSARRGIVEDAVGRHHAGTERLLLVEDQRRSVERGHAAARILDEERAGTDVPLVLRREREGRVPEPVASSASLKATLPVSRTCTRPLNASHSPRLSSERHELRGQRPERDDREDDRICDASRRAGAPRSVQTRTYTGQNPKTIMKTLLAVLQDDGFVVHYGNAELGLLDASKSVARLDDGDFNLDLPTRVRNEIAGATSGITTVEATANVSDLGDRVSVRINFQRRLTDNGGRTRVAQVTDAKGYQEFFAKLDKGFFLQREGL